MPRDYDDSVGVPMNVADSRTGLKYQRKRCKSQPEGRVDCVDYTIHPDSDPADCWGRIRTDRHSSKVMVIRVSAGYGRARRHLDISPIKFSSEQDAAQALRLVREYVLAGGEVDATESRSHEAVR